MKQNLITLLIVIIFSIQILEAQSPDFTYTDATGYVGQNNYSGKKIYLLIKPAGASKVAITFDETIIIGRTYFKIYDGNDSIAPLLLSVIGCDCDYSNITQSITSTGNALFFEFYNIDGDDLEFYYHGVYDSIGWKINGSNEVLNLNGNVGINTSFPTEKLEVIGNVKATNFIGNGSYLSGIVSSQWSSKSNSYGQNICYNSGQDYTGFVGINTYNPTEKLEVVGNVKATKFIGDGSQLTGIGVWKLNGSNVTYMNGNAGINTNTPSEKLEVVGNIKATAFIGDGSGLTGLGWKLNGSNLTYMSGNAGINTNTPSEKLEVVGNIKATAFVGDGSQLTGVTTSQSDLVLNGSNSWILHTPDDGRTEMHIAPMVNGNWQWSHMVLYQNGNTYFRGNVGIGTSTPEAPLTVKGKILAGEMEIRNVDYMPDYVFNTDYKLTPLPVLEQYVKTNKHLPEVPSAKEFKDKGMNVADMNSTLLKKVEELTLYLIEQQKMIEQLKKENQEIKTIIIK